MRIAISIEYKGTNYLGWQKNGDNKSICNEIENALFRITNSQIKVAASGRTDAGVHALAQVAHLDLPENCQLNCKNLIKSINKELPFDIRVTSCKEVSNKFHARYNVKSKTYLYQLYTSQVSSPLKSDLYAHVPAVLNLEAMREGAKVFEGKHNFKAFCLSGGDSESFDREVISIDIIRKKDDLYFYVKGKGFLYSMVRLIVGTLIAVGQNKVSCEQIKLALESGDKKFNSEKMPACGLYLYQVEY